MNRKTIIATVLLIFGCLLSQAQSTEADAVKQVVTSAYINGIHNNGSIDDIRKGFHPTFTMLRLIENDVKPYPIEEWIAAIEKRGKEGASSAVQTVGKFISVDVTGNAAVVKLELYREDKKTFTDYIVLYKFSEGWKIVSKTYYRH